MKRDFINETSILLQLKSNSVVKYIDFGECGDGLFIVMDYCNKGNLKDRLARKGVFSEYEILAVASLTTPLPWGAYGKAVCRF